MEKTNVAVSWSGGKDSCFALYHVLKENNYNVKCLITTVTEGFERISIHGVRETLLDKQAESLGIELLKIYIPQQCTNEIYEEKMIEGLENIKNKYGLSDIVFGDIFLEDVKAYREKLLDKAAMKAIFPLWGKTTRALIDEFINLNFLTITTCIDTEKIDQSFLGRIINEKFLEDLPLDVDPCGENGEFHTFVFSGPLFNEPLKFAIGEKVDRGRFHFCDLI